MLFCLKYINLDSTCITNNFRLKKEFEMKLLTYTLIHICMYLANYNFFFFYVFSSPPNNCCITMYFIILTVY